MEFLKRKMQGEDLYDSVSGVTKRHTLPWSTLAHVTTDGAKSDWEKKHPVAPKNPGEVKGQPTAGGNFLSLHNPAGPSDLLTFI